MCTSLQHGSLFARRAVSLALVFAMCGFCCAFCGVACAREARAGAHAEASCTEHACCVERAGAGARAANADGRGVCCAPSRGAATLPEKHDVPQAGATPEAESVAPLMPRRAAAPTLSVASRVPDRGGTYLLCCVFLI